MDDRAAALLQLLFQAPGEVEAWWRFYEDLAVAISPAARVVMLAENTRPEPYTMLFGSHLERGAPGVLPRHGDGKQRIDALPLGTVFPLTPHGILARNPVVHGLLEAEGLAAGPGLGVAVAREGAWVTAILLVLSRHGHWVPTEADRQLVNQLAPFLPHVVRLHRRIQGAEALTSILDYLALGVVLLDDRGRVSYENRSAAELFGVTPGLEEAGERDARTAALYRAITPGRPEEGVLYTHPADGRTLQLLEADLDWPDAAGMTARRFRRALFIGDPKRRSSGDPTERMAQLYGLTASETKLAWLLVGDVPLADAATQLGITQSTARTVLKRILAKTGARRQASLVHLLLSGPAQLRDDAPLASPRTSPRKRRRS